MAKLTVRGLDDLQKGLKRNVKMDDVRRVVKHNGSQLHQKMVKNADFTKGYATGTTKRSIYLVFEDMGLTAVAEPSTEYSQYLEYGTRFMDAQPFVAPAFEEQSKKFKSDLQKLTR